MLLIYDGSNAKLNFAFMNLELLTKRLRMTPLTEQDIDISTAIWTDPEVVKYICEPSTVEELKVEMPLVTKRGGNGCIGIWCVADRLTGEKYGEAYLLPMPVEEHDVDHSLLVPEKIPDGEIELGYFLKKSAWGKGYATEISACLLKFIFETTPLNELIASVNDENLASKHVLEKSGFVYRNHALAWGERCPIYHITREQWTQA